MPVINFTDTDLTPPGPGIPEEGGSSTDLTPGDGTIPGASSGSFPIYIPGVGDIISGGGIDPGPGTGASSGSFPDIYIPGVGDIISGGGIDPGPGTGASSGDPIISVPGEGTGTIPGASSGGDPISKSPEFLASDQGKSSLVEEFFVICPPYEPIEVSDSEGGFVTDDIIGIISVDGPMVGVSNESNGSLLDKQEKLSLAPEDLDFVVCPPYEPIEGAKKENIIIDAITSTEALELGVSRAPSAPSVPSTPATSVIAECWEGNPIMICPPDNSASSVPDIV